MLEDFKKKLNVSQEINPETSIFWNLALDKGTLKSFISWFLQNYGEKKTLQILEELKHLGFGYATKAGISLGIEDLKIPPKKVELLANSERLVTESQIAYRRGDITGIEKMQLFIETWTETSETLKDEVVSYFEKTDVLNPVYMMAFSGARGNMSQVRQLVGMRGLMSDPQGKIIDFPIQSNFREGLTLTEYLISTYGARKGIVDTALRTATAGYLTRRLVDVAQHVVVSKFDCKTKRGIFLFDMKEGIKTIYSFPNRLMGRVLAQDVFENVSIKAQIHDDFDKDKMLTTKVVKIAARNQEINATLASKIAKVTKKALVRSPLTCQTRKLVCQLCYGWSLSTSKLVAIGEAVGVIAGQSIGEPGTQLTMRTFHTGGVFSSTVTEQINAPFEALIEYAEPIAGTCIRTSQGNLAFLTKASGTLFLKKYEHNTVSNTMNTYKIPAFTLIFARHGQLVKKDDLLAQVSAFPVSQKSTQIIEQTIYSSLEGEVYYNQLDLLNDIEEKYGERTSKSENWAQVWVLSAKILKTSLSLNSSFFPDFGDYVSKNSIINQIEWISLSSNVDEMHVKNQLATKIKQSSYSEKYIREYIPTTFSQKNSVNNLQKQKSTLSNIHKKDNKNSFQILSNYKIKKTFLFHDEFILKKNLLTTIIVSDSLINSKKPAFQDSLPNFKDPFTSFGTVIQTSLFVQNNEIRKTEFIYPYQQTTRAYLTKLLTRTSIHLPLLKPGILQSWITSRTQTKKQFSFIKTKSLSTSFEILRKLTLHKKFKVVSDSNQNFLYPLFLANLIPFYLNPPALKTYLQAKHLCKNFKTEILKKNLMQKIFRQLKPLTFNQTEKFNHKLFLKNKTIPQFQFTFKLNSNSQLLSKSLEPSKLESLSINNTILTLKTQKTVYKKLGYLSYVFIEKQQKDKLFSFLPLNANISPISRIMKGIPLKTVGLENTYNWSPTSNIGFKWFPSFSNLKASGVFLMNPSSFFHRNLYEKIMLTPSKNPKFHLLYVNKYQDLLNLSQSQIFKKNSFLKETVTNSLDLVIRKEQWVKNFQSFYKVPNLSGVFHVKAKRSQKVIRNFSRSSSRKQTMFFQPAQKLSSRQANQHKRFLINIKNITKTKSFLNSAIKYEPLKLVRPFKNKDFQVCLNFRVKYKMEKNETLNFNLNKFVLFKKRNLVYSNQRHLIIKFDPFEKLSFSLDQFEFIPQENYCFQTILPLTAKEISQEYPNFNFLKNSKHLNKKSFNFYLTNPQGFRKELKFFQEGFLMLKENNLNAESEASQSSIQKFNGSTLKNDLKREIKSSKKNHYNSEKFFLLDFKKRSPSFLECTRFKKQQMSTNVEVLSRSNLLKYLRTKSLLNSFGSRMKENNLNEMNFVSLPTNSKFKFFSFIPFLKAKKLEKNDFDSITNKFNDIRSSKIQHKEFHINIKPGWIYKLEVTFDTFDLHKRVFDSGRLIFDDIYFNDQKVLTEIIQIQNFGFEKLQNTYAGQMEAHGRKFEKQLSLKNKKCRFLNLVQKENFSYKTQKSSHSLYLLIRPSQSYRNPNLQELKRKLYNSVQQVQFNDSNRSYSLYTQYFSQTCNQQKKRVRTISNFVPLDLNIKSTNLFPFLKSFYEIQKEKISKFKPKVNKEKSFLKVKEKSLMSSLLLIKFLLSCSSKKSYSKVLTSMIYKPKRFKVNEIKQKNMKPMSHMDILYFSNYPTNYCTLTISLKVSNPRLLNFSFSKILFNMNHSSVYLFQNFSKEIYKTLKVNYLNLLIFRNHLKHINFGTLAPALLNSLKDNKRIVHTNFADFVKRQTFNKLSTKKRLPSLLMTEKKIQDLFALTCFSSNYSGLPKFEYVLDQTYSFLANQKVLATSFYKQQFKMSLNLNGFKNSGLTLKHNISKQFSQKQFKNRAFSESYYLVPKSKNTFLFKSQSLKLKPNFSLTNFYSPFEGEILKDYATESNLENLKKSLNVNLEDGLLSERQSEKLILTKSDIFGLPLSLSNKLITKSKTDFLSLSVLDSSSLKEKFFNEQTTKSIFDLISQKHGVFNSLEKACFDTMASNRYVISDFNTNYKTKQYKVKNLNFYLDRAFTKFRLGNFLKPGDKLYSNRTFLKSGQLIHLNSRKLTLRKAEFFAISPKAILHTYNGHSITKNTPVMTLPFETLKTGDIVQGIPKVEQYLESRTTIQGRLFLNSLPVLLHAIYKRYSQKLNFEKAVRQSFLKIQQILVDGVQRVYRSQGVSIADKHLEVIVRQMTSKVKIVYGGQTGFFAGELVDLEFVERINQFLMVKIQYEPVVLGITRSSLEVDSFLSAASFQQTTKVLTKAALEQKKDFLKGLKENLLVGNLLPAGTGYVIPLS